MNTRSTIFSLCLALGTPLFGQGLHKEINVEQEIVPVKRDAARITILPTLQLPAVSKPQLAFSNRVVTTRVPNSISTLEPVAYGENLFSSPYRGYVALGLGAPLFNGAFSAGYRILDTDRTRLSAWGQYDGDIYTQKTDERKEYWRDHSASLGVDLHQAIGSKSFLNAGVDYTYGYHTIPSAWDSFSQSISRFNLSALYTSRAQGLDWTAALRYRHFGFYNSNAPQRLHFISSVPDTDFPIHIFTPGQTGAADSPAPGQTEVYAVPGESPVRQNLFGASLTGKLSFGDNTSLGLDADADFLHTGSHLSPRYPYLSYGDYSAKDGSTVGLIALTPHLDYSSATVKARIGAQVDVSINNGRVFHIAPEASLAWTPSQLVGFEIKAHGGSDLNQLSSLYDVTPYLNSSMAYSQSHIPYALDGRVTVGPFFGAYLEFFGGYAKANDWLMPVVADSYLGGAVFDRIDLSAWHGGAAVGYDYRKQLSARISYETAPNDYDNSFYEWRDRARHVVNAELKLRPLTPLQITLGWQFRAGRRCYGMADNLSGATGDLQIYSPQARSLGCVSDLSLGASYAATDALSIFAGGENLLNRRYYRIGDRYSQGIRFMIGASLKF
ncbi:TonB-dependent receptor [Duncaniella muris]|uniref:TonB-dependent receptor n=2 Tax=Muribaculaceae TaxID=2005473 RepID=UPI001C3E112D|nr:TonB-dependent receptor [Duncaniella muris]